MESIVNILGWFGTCLLVLGYILISAKKVHGRSISYQLFNLIGSIFLGVNSYYYGAFPSVSPTLRSRSSKRGSSRRLSKAGWEATRTRKGSYCSKARSSNSNARSFSSHQARSAACFPGSPNPGAWTPLPNDASQPRIADLSPEVP